MSEAEAVTLRERVRERLAQIIEEVAIGGFGKVLPAADTIMAEFRLQPVAWGRVTEGGEVEGF
jgi:hypothetical protein